MQNVLLSRHKYQQPENFHITQIKQPKRKKMSTLTVPYVFNICKIFKFSENATRELFENKFLVKFAF